MCVLNNVRNGFLILRLNMACLWLGLSWFTGLTINKELVGRNVTWFVVEWFHKTPHVWLICLYYLIRESKWGELWWVVSGERVREKGHPTGRIPDCIGDWLAGENLVQLLLVIDSNLGAPCRFESMSEASWDKRRHPLRVKNMHGFHTRVLNDSTPPPYHVSSSIKKRWCNRSGLE